MWADKIEFLETMEEQGRTPQALEDRPSCAEWLIPYITAYHMLMRTRRYSMGGDHLPIQLVEIKAYLDLYPNHKDPHFFIDVITHTDGEYLAFVAEKNKIKNKT